MQINLIIFFLTLIMMTVSSSALSYRVGYHSGYNKGNIICNNQKDKIISRKQQEVIHEILGKYQNNYTDNNTYDFNAINELFRKGE